MGNLRRRIKPPLIVGLLVGYGAGLGSYQIGFLPVWALVSGVVWGLAVYIALNHKAEPPRRE